MLALISLIGLLGACASVAPPPPAAAPDCMALYAAVDHAVLRHGAAVPSASARIEGFPYLRIDRFLASYRDQPLDGAERSAWLARLAELDREARQVELAALPEGVLGGLAAHRNPAMSLSQALAACGKTLQADTLADPKRFALLRSRAQVPDDYRLAQRVIGLYPLTALPVSVGVSRWQRQVRQTFAAALEDLPVQGELRRFSPPPSTEQASLPIARDALGIAVPSEAQLNALFTAHAPVWEIDTAGAFDRPGAPVWQSAEIPSVDPTEAVVYRYPSYTRWRGEPLLQLNYVIWFAERPLSGPLDILGGFLDGLVWRVTLDAQGRPLIYDSIHPCGCYQQFFPSSGLRLRRSALGFAEPPLIPQYAPVLTPGTRLVVRLSSGAHAIQRIYADRPSGTVYRWRDYQTLYSVSGVQFSRSLFGPEGLVSGSERAERWLLWPMGIASPGAMRERGHQATAFVGRRHFDDPDLLERLFQPGDSE